MTNSQPVTSQDIQRIAREVVTLAIQELPTFADVERIVGHAVEKQTQVYKEHDEKRAREYYDMMNSVDRHLRSVEITMSHVSQTVAEFKGLISSLPDLKSEVAKLQDELNRQATTNAVVKAAYDDLNDDIFGESSGKPPSLYRILIERGARADEQHHELIRILQDDIKPRLETAEKYIESRRAIEQRVLSIATTGWKYIAESRTRFTILAIGISLVAAQFISPQTMADINKLIHTLLGG